jgi:hypothetical protein
VVGGELKDSGTDGAGEMVGGGEWKESGTGGSGEMVSEWWREVS